MRANPRAIASPRVISSQSRITLRMAAYSLPPHLLEHRNQRHDADDESD